MELHQPARPEAASGPARHYDQAGFVHVALVVDDVDLAYQRLRAAGIASTGLPRKTTVSPVADKTALFNDPDGIQVELVDRKRDQEVAR